MDNIYYIRFKDGKKFTFKLIQDNGFYDGKSMVLLNGVQIRFNTFYDDNVTFIYPDGSKVKYLLNHLDKDQARRIKIEDYNFDGVDDVAFETARRSEPSHLYDVFIYDHLKKTFNKLSEPESGCGSFMDLKVDRKKKRLLTQCKSGTRWRNIIYTFNQAGKLVLVKGN